MNDIQEFNNDELVFTRGVIEIILEHRFAVAFGITGLFTFACIGSLIDDKMKNKKGAC